jgi:hypothetical protein
MIIKSKLAYGAMSAKYQSPFKEERSDAKRSEPMDNQALLFLVLLVTLVCAVTDGVAAVIYHVG